MVYRFRPDACGRMEFWPMAGISAGVVTEAQVEGLPQAPTRMAVSLSSPATWSFIWAGLSFIYLFAIYVGMLNISRKGR